MHWGKLSDLSNYMYNCHHYTTVRVYAYREECVVLAVCIMVQQYVYDN